MNNEKPLGNEETQEKEIMRARQKVEDILQKFYSLKEYIQEYVDCNRRKENLPVYMKREKEHFDSCEASLTEAIQIREEKIEKLKKLFDEVEQSAHSLSGPESVPELTKKIYLHNSALNAVKFQDSQIASYKKLHAQHYQKYSDYRKNLEDAQSMLDQLYNELDALLRGSDIEELKKFIGNHMQREDLVEELDQNLNEIVHPERRASVLQALQNIERALLTEEFCLEGGELIDEPCFDRNEYRKMYRVSTSHSPVRRGRGRKPERFQKETDLQVQIRWLIRRDMPEVLSIEEEKEEEEGDKKSEEEFLSFIEQEEEA